MSGSHLTIPAKDGFPLAASLYAPSLSSGSRIVVVNSATGVRRGYYDPFARFLCGEGFTVLTYDYRGIGGSLPVPVSEFQARMRDWGQEDIAGVLDWIAGNYPDSGILALGHSVGGQVFGLAAGGHRVRAMVMVAAQNGYWGHWDSPQRYQHALLWFAVLPVLTAALSYFPARRLGLGEDLPAGVAREWAAWCRDPQYLFGARHGLDLRHYAALQAPLLACSIEDDAYAPRRAVEALASRYTGAQVTRRHWTPGELGVRTIGHFGYFRESFRNSLWRETADWLKLH